MYKGFIDGKVYVKSLAMGDKNHVFIYGLSEELTKKLYTKLTSMSIKNMDALDEIESSAIKEMCNILSSYAIGIITKDNVSTIKFKENIYVGKYDTDSDLRNSVVVSLDTSIGKIEIMYCVKQICDRFSFDELKRLIQLQDYLIPENIKLIAAAPGIPVSDTVIEGNSS